MKPRERIPLIERLLKHLVVHDSGCMTLDLARNYTGYTSLRHNNKNWRAHRLVYAEFVGPIPNGLTLDHLCKNRGCINVSHLEVVTMRVNVLRSSGITALNLSKTHCKRGHPLCGENLYVPRSGRRVCRTCARARGREASKHRQCGWERQRRRARVRLAAGE